MTYCRKGLGIIGVECVCSVYVWFLRFGVDSDCNFNPSLLSLEWGLSPTRDPESRRVGNTLIPSEISGSDNSNLRTDVSVHYSPLGPGSVQGPTPLFLPNSRPRHTPLSQVLSCLNLKPSLLPTMPVTSFRVFLFPEPSSFSVMNGRHLWGSSMSVTMSSLSTCPVTRDTSGVLLCR